MTKGWETPHPPRLNLSLVDAFKGTIAPPSKRAPQAKIHSPNYLNETKWHLTTTRLHCALVSRVAVLGSWTPVLGEESHTESLCFS